MSLCIFIEILHFFNWIYLKHKLILYRVLLSRSSSRSKFIITNSSAVVKIFWSPSNSGSIGLDVHIYRSIIFELNNVIGLSYLSDLCIQTAFMIERCANQSFDSLFALIYFQYCFSPWAECKVERVMSVDSCGLRQVYYSGRLNECQSSRFSLRYKT